METETEDRTGRSYGHTGERLARRRVHEIAKYFAHLITATKQRLLWRASRGQLITGLELNDSYVKLAQLRKTAKGLRLVKVAVEKISPFTDGRAPKAIAALFEKELRASKRHVIVSLPRHSTIVRKILLPSVKEDEIEQMVVYQAQRYVPYGEDEMTVGHQIICQREDGYSEVMLVVAHNDVVTKYTRFLREANLRPEILMLDSEALCDSYVHNPDRQKYPVSEPVAMVDVDYSFTTIQVICGDKFSYSRSIDLGSSQSLVDSDSNRPCEELLSELSRTFAAYAADNSVRAISRIVLSGATSTFPDLYEVIGERFRVPVETFDPFLGLELAQDAAEKLDSETEEFSFAAVIGLTLDRHERKVNLLPRTLRERRKRQAKRKELLKLGIAFLCAMILGSGLLYKRIHDKEEYLASLSEQLQTIDPLITRIETMRREVAIIQGELGAGSYVLDVLYELYRKVPPTIFLSVFTFEHDGKVSLKGSSLSMREVLDLLPKLESSPLLRNVTVQYLTKRRAESNEYVDFVIQLELTTEK